MKTQFTNNNSNLEKLFTNWAGEEVKTIKPIPESGSARKYYRIKGDSKCAIGVYNPDKLENKAFLYLSAHLKENKIQVPQIFASDADKDIYLEEDLGDITLYKFLHENSNNQPLILNTYKSVIREMPKLQIHAAKGLNFNTCYPRAEFDRQSMIWDLNYFKSYFLKLTGISFYEQYLEDDFDTFINYLLEATRNFFLFRDFQSRNIMLINNNIYFIDYQGGRKGALQYDLASLLFEAKTNLSPLTRDELLEYYMEAFYNEPSFNKKEFLKYYYGYVLIRMLQAFGAYGYRGYYERKHFFLKSIPPAVKNLEWFIQHVDLGIKIPQLWNCFEQIILSPFINEFEESAETLTINLNSFSYKNGIPLDNTEHGGGFVFDCRALPNPGKFDQYKSYTGKDNDVIVFLNDKPEVNQFLNNAYSLVEASIKNYQKRGFTNLMINFGCTGGQHRSVYCAEKLAERIKQNFDIKVILKHKELEKQLK